MLHAIIEKNYGKYSFKLNAEKADYWKYDAYSALMNLSRKYAQSCTI